MLLSIIKTASQLVGYMYVDKFNKNYKRQANQISICYATMATINSLHNNFENQNHKTKHLIPYSGTLAIATDLTQ